MSDREKRALDLLRRVRPTIERLGHMGAEDGCPACSFLTSIDALLAETEQAAHPTHAEQALPHEVLVALGAVFDEWDNEDRLMPSTESMEALRAVVSAHVMKGASPKEQDEPKVGETWLVPGGKVVDIHTSPSGTRLVTLSEYGHVHGRVFMADWLRANGRRVGGE